MMNPDPKNDQPVLPPEVTTAMIKNPLKVGKYRNKKCICSSGKKVKHCCGVFMQVPFNLGNFWINVIAGDKEKAEFFAQAFEDDMKGANKLVKENASEAKEE